VTSKSPIRNSTGYIAGRLVHILVRLLLSARLPLAGSAKRPSRWREDADHSLVRAVRSGAVRERNDSQPEPASESDAHQPS
jgi:hypothetical protein